MPAGDGDRRAPDPGALDRLDRAATDPGGVDHDGDSRRHVPACARSAWPPPRSPRTSGRSDRCRSVYLVTWAPCAGRASCPRAIPTGRPGRRPRARHRDPADSSTLGSVRRIRARAVGSCSKPTSNPSLHFGLSLLLISSGPQADSSPSAATRFSPRRRQGVVRKRRLDFSTVPSATLLARQEVPAKLMVIPATSSSPHENPQTDPSWCSGREPLIPMVQAHRPVGNANDLFRNRRAGRAVRPGVSLPSERCVRDRW